MAPECNLAGSDRYDWSPSDEHEYFVASKFKASGVLPIIWLEFFVNRSVQKRFVMKALAGSVMVMGMAAQAGAAGLLLPGQWRSDYRVLINGRDSTAVMSKVVTQLRTAMPSQVTNVRASLNSNGNLGISNVCLPEQSAAALATPRDIFNTFSKLNPTCKLVAGKASATSMPFTGRCTDTTGFTGPVSGQVVVSNNMKWNATMEGAGRFPDAVLASLSIPAKTSVMVKTTVSNNRMSATCQ